LVAVDPVCDDGYPLLGHTAGFNKLGHMIAKDHICVRMPKREVPQALEQTYREALRFSLADDDDVAAFRVAHQHKAGRQKELHAALAIALR